MEDVPVSLAQARVRMSYNLRAGTFSVTRLHNSIRLAKLQTRVTIGARSFASSDKACVNTVARRDALRLIVQSAIEDGPTWETRFEIRGHPNEGNALLDRALRDGYGVAISCRLVGDSAGGQTPRFSLAGQAVTPRDAFACRLAPMATSTPLQIASGDAGSGLNTGFYDPKDDCALHLGARQVSIGSGQRHRLDKSHEINMDFTQTACVDFAEHFYETVHGFKYLRQTKLKRPPRPTAGWLDWYLTYGKTDEARLLREVDWLAANLRDFGLEVIQIDDGWQAHHAERLPGRLGQKPTDWLRSNEKFPHGMAWMAEQIHARGFRAGIWLVPYATNDAALVRDHPEWFLKDTSGTMKSAHGNWATQFGYLLDLSQPQVRRHHLEPLFETLSSRWGYDYFKLDATGWTLLAIKDEPFGEKGLSGAEIIRAGLDKIRGDVGDKFILACHSPCPEVVGLVEAARVAGDMSPGWERGPLHLRRQTMETFHTHAICWLSDPDCLVIRPPLTADQARVFVSMFGLTGQHLMLSDPAEALDSERIEMLRRVLPVCATRPMDLFARSDQALIWDLKIERPFASWDVVGVFNFDTSPTRCSVRFADLGLAAEGSYVVYDFWKQQCLGEVEKEIALDLPPTSCRVVAIHRAAGRPQLVSTSRHITQGGVDLVALAWDERRNELSGRSRLVGGDPYEMRFWVPPSYRVASVASTASTATLQVADNGRLAALRVDSPESGEVCWQVHFERK